MTVVALVVLTGGVLGACSDPEPQPYFDLVDQLPTPQIEDQVEGPDTVGDALGAPAADRLTDRLFLPAGSSVSYALFPQPDSSLSVDRLAVRGEGTELVLTVESDDGELRLISQSRSQRSWSEDLGVPGDTPVRLTLQATTPEATRGDGVLLTDPVIYGLATEPSSENLAPDHRPAASGAEETPDSNGSQKPNIIIYLIDTLRRDRVGSYGYDRPVSPEIDKFASEATIFASSYGQSSWTKPSVASLFSGVWPPKHGATGWKHRLPKSFETMPERLQQAGWSTAGFVTNVNAGTAFGIAQGFDTLWYKRKVDAVTVNEQVFRWLDTIDRSRPFLLYVHTMDPHAGYKPSEPFRSRFAPTADEMSSWSPRWKWPVEYAPFFSDLYDGEVAQNDAAFGALLDRLRELDLYNDSLVIFLSDHGEEFREHGGWRHNRRLFAETLDVPMIVKFPGQKEAKRSDVPVSHVDIMPTVLDVAGLPAFEATDGQSLTSPVRRPVFSHLRVGRYPLQYSVIRGRWKLIRTHKKGRKTQLFDLESDPGETRNLAPELPVRVAAMEALLDRKLATVDPANQEEATISEETERELRALGYLQ